MRVADRHSFGLALRRHADDIDIKARRLGWQVDIYRNSGIDTAAIESKYRRYIAASNKLWQYAAKRAGIPVCCYIRHGTCGRTNHA